MPTTLHLVSHTHWDREWYLPFQQFRLKLVRLMDNLLDLLDADPQYCHFMLDGQTIVLEDYLAIRPERKADLRRHIESGRLVIGPWHILPDEYLVSPEATIRNLLEGDRTARRFGNKMAVGYIPDPFGHIGQMPQILNGFEIDSASVQRGLSDEPAEFWWEAPDGSRVFMAYERDGYGNAAGLPTGDPERFTSEVQRLRDSLLAHSLCPPGSAHVLLMHGTDHMEPPPNTSALVGYAQKSLDGDCIVHSTLPEYLKSVRGVLSGAGIELPVVRGELRSPKRYHMLPGVLSARMWIKQRNQACQTLLEKWAEPFSTWAEYVDPAQAAPLSEAASGLPFQAEPRVRQPAGFLWAAWRTLMECHPHDSICGCSVDQVHEEMRPRFDQAQQIGEEITQQSLAAIALAADTRHSASQQAAGAIVVFNPLSTPVGGSVRTTLQLPPGVERFEIVDEAGQVTPHQASGLESHEVINVRLDRQGFIAAFGTVNDGQIAGMVVQQAVARRDGSQVHIEVLLGEKGKPDPQEWSRGKAEITALTQDASIKEYIVRARTVPSAETLFAVPRVPGLGYRTFWVRPLPTQASTAQPLRVSRLAANAARLTVLSGWASKAMRSSRQPKLSDEQAVIENEVFIVRPSQASGTFTLQDKRSGIIFEGLNRFTDEGDRGDEYNFCPVEGESSIQARVTSLTVQCGLVEQSIEMHLELKLPAGLVPHRGERSSSDWVRLPIVTRAVLTAGQARLDFETEIENTARDHRLRVHFPAPFQTGQSLSDGHFEFVARPLDLPAYDSTWAEQPRPELPQRAFTALCGETGGLMLANRGLPEIEALRLPGGTGLALTLLRCVGWLSRDDFASRPGHAGPFLETPGAQMQGRHRFEYSAIPFLAPQAGQPIEQSLPYAQAYAFNAPLRAASTSVHAGGLPASGSLAEVSPAAFVVSAVKPAESGQGWVLRGYNVSAAPLEVKIKPWRPFARVEQVSLSEHTIQPLEPASDGSIKLAAGGHQIVSVHFFDA